jgi:uncharacterized protein (TIGR02996 family)
MDHGPALFQEILAHPDDDVPRLVYADWLEERGDPRGEFVRAQVELARMPIADRRYPELKFREQQLLAEHRQRWQLPELYAIANHQEFRRGFVEAIRLTEPSVMEEAFLKREGERLFGMTPVREITFGFASERFDLLGEFSWMQRIRRLQFSPTRVYAEMLQRLFASPHLSELREVGLHHGACQLQHVRALAPLTKLAVLNLGGFNRQGQSSFADMIEALPASLTCLDLHGSAIQPIEVAALASRNPPLRLTALNLDRCSIGAEGARTLADCPHLSALREVQLAYCGIGVGGAVRLARSKHWSNLEALVLERNELNSIAVVELMRSRTLTRLTTLDLAQNHIGQEGLQALASSPNAQHLHTLQLDWNYGFGDLGLTPLAESSVLTNLRRLFLTGNYLYDRDVQALVQSSTITRLCGLTLRHNQITDRGVTALAQSPQMSNLLELDLGHNPIGDDGAVALSVSPHLNKLLRLQLDNTNIGAKGSKALTARFGLRVQRS